MSDERRYNEEEIAAIFKRAAADQGSPQGGRRDGLTLAEIEQIGREAGLSPESIARAAAGLNQTTPPPTTSLGMPVSVARTVDLPGDFSDEDWDRLVADLHEAFPVPGEVRRDGSLRQWKNDQLHVLVEPTESGYRLRLRTLNETLRAGLLGGLLFFVMGLFFMLIVAAKGDFLVDMGKTVFVSLFALMGLGGMGISALRLPRWREEQARRLESIAARAAERAGAKSPEALQEPEAAPRLDLGLPAEDEQEEPARTRHRSRS